MTCYDRMLICHHHRALCDRDWTILSRLVLVQDDMTNMSDVCLIWPSTHAVFLV